MLLPALLWHVMMPVQWLGSRCVHAHLWRRAQVGVRASGLGAKCESECERKGPPKAVACVEPLQQRRLVLGGCG